MPYASNTELPHSVRAHMPKHAQDIFREAFNHAFATYKSAPNQEEIAHRVAWSAVKRKYKKVGDAWVEFD